MLTWFLYACKNSSVAPRWRWSREFPLAKLQRDPVLLIIRTFFVVYRLLLNSSIHCVFVSETFLQPTITYTNTDTATPQLLTGKTEKRNSAISPSIIIDRLSWLVTTACTRRILWVEFYLLYVLVYTELMETQNCSNNNITLEYWWRIALERNFTFGPIRMKADDGCSRNEIWNCHANVTHMGNLAGKHTHTYTHTYMHGHRSARSSAFECSDMCINIWCVSENIRRDGYMHRDIRVCVLLNMRLCIGPSNMISLNCCCHCGYCR